MAQVVLKKLLNDSLTQLQLFKILIINRKDGWLTYHSSFFA
jgi:hypothetical protein